METQPRTPDPTAGSDAAWAFVAPYLTQMRLDGPQRTHDRRAVDNALRWIVRVGAPVADAADYLPPVGGGLPTTRRWIGAGCFAAMVHDLRVLLRWTQGRADNPTAAILDSRTLPSPPESGARAGDDGHKRRTGSTIHLAVDTLGHLLAVQVTPADDQDRAHVGVLAAMVQVVTGETVEVAFVDQGYTGNVPREAAAVHAIRLAVAKLPDAKRGFILLPRRWGVERSFAWASRFRRLVRDDERLPETVAGLHFVAFACLMLQQLLTRAAQSPSHALGVGLPAFALVAGLLVPAEPCRVPTQ